MSALAAPHSSELLGTTNNAHTRWQKLYDTSVPYVAETSGVLDYPRAESYFVPELHEPTIREHSSSVARLLQYFEEIFSAPPNPEVRPSPDSCAKKQTEDPPIRQYYCMEDESNGASKFDEQRKDKSGQFQRTAEKSPHMFNPTEAKENRTSSQGRTRSAYASVPKHKTLFDEQSHNMFMQHQHKDQRILETLLALDPRFASDLAHRAPTTPRGRTSSHVSAPTTPRTWSASCVIRPGDTMRPTVLTPPASIERRMPVSTMFTIYLLLSCGPNAID